MTASKFHIMMLPPELTEKIIYSAFIGRESPDVETPDVETLDVETLDSCRKVCGAWNEIIKGNKEWRIISQSMIERNWAQHRVPESFPSNKMIVHAKALGKSKDNLRTTYCKLKSTIFFVESDGILPTGVMESLARRVREEVDSRRGHLKLITSAASLAHQGLLGPVRRLSLTSVSAEHMTSLVSCVTESVSIGYVYGCDLVTILDSVKSQELKIYCQRLGREETEALVRAMDTRVERLWLEEVTLDIETLTKYDGLGKCFSVKWYDTTRRYIDLEQLKKTWAQRIHWEVIPSSLRGVEMKRP